MQLPVTSGYSDALCEDGGTMQLPVTSGYSDALCEDGGTCNYLLLVVILMHCVKVEAHAITCY